MIRDIKIAVGATTATPESQATSSAQNPARARKTTEEDGYEVVSPEQPQQPMQRRGISRVARATPLTASLDGPAVQDAWLQLRESIIADNILSPEASIEELQQMRRMMMGIRDGTVRIMESPSGAARP